MSTKWKLQALVHSLSEMESVVVAYSGGVDSTLLLSVAHEVLGKRVLAATAVSASKLPFTVCWTERAIWDLH